MNQRTYSQNTLFILQTGFVYLILSIACFLMLRTVIGYTSFQDDTQFLAYKQNYIHNSMWKTSFYIHVFSAIVALFAGFTQFSTSLRHDHPKAHRIFGYIYIIDILLINFPAAMIMAVYANGGLLGKAAFTLLNILWCLFTFQALTKARLKKFALHKDYMIRSYALTFSAITLRSWKIILSHAFVLSAAHLYILEAWLGFIPNIIVAEFIIRYTHRYSAKLA